MKFVYFYNKKIDSVNYIIIKMINDIKAFDV